MSEDRIHIEQLEIQANVGVPEDERATPQRLIVSITLTPPSAFAALDDGLESTIDYAAVCEAVKEHVRGRSFKLIETLAHQLAALVKERFAAKRVEIEVRKFILPDTAYVAVRTAR